MEDNYDIKKLCTKKKRVNSKTKGGTFERKIASTLNERFNTSEFSRTPGSGAYATTHNLPEHLKIYGDLITPKNFAFCIECKKGYNNIKLNHLLDYSSTLWGFLKQSEEDTKKTNNPFIHPLVIFKQDRQKTLAFTKKLSCFNLLPKLMINDWSMFYFDDLLNVGDDYWFF